MAILPIGTTFFTRMERVKTVGAFAMLLRAIDDRPRHRGRRHPQRQRWLDIPVGADGLVDVSAPSILDVEALETMVRNSSVFAMAKPTPGTRGSDFAQSGQQFTCHAATFRGALDARASRISEQREFAAARGSAAVIGDERRAEYVIPSVFDSRVIHVVALAVREKAIEEGLARRALFVQDEDSMLATAK